jgi:hypothetical protein
VGSWRNVVLVTGLDSFSGAVENETPRAVQLAVGFRFIVKAKATVTVRATIPTTVESDTMIAMSTTPRMRSIGCD